MVKKFNERKEAWFRIIVGIVSGIILSIWKGFIEILAIVNWFIIIFTEKRNKEIAEFCEYWNSELYRFFKYMTFVSNKRPFPFSNMGKRISKVE